MRLPTFPDHLDDIQRKVLAEFPLDLMGIHGIPHWSRVLRNGMLIAAMDGNVDMEVVTLFALLHDSQREDEGVDIEHGVRGSRFAQMLRDNGAMPWLDKEQFTALKAAILGHPLGYLIEGDHWTQRTIQACWDADRLDLGRVGIKPDIMRMGSLYATQPGITDLHWQESWEVDGMEATIPWTEPAIVS